MDKAQLGDCWRTSNAEQGKSFGRSEQIKEYWKHGEIHCNRNTIRFIIVFLILSVCKMNYGGYKDKIGLFCNELLIRRIHVVDEYS